MTPGARLQSAILLLESIGAGRTPADEIVGTYFRRHRFAGVKDRAAISSHVYGVLRRRGMLDWWIERFGVIPNSRHRLLADLALFEEWDRSAVTRACDGDRFRPARLNEAELVLVDALASANPRPKEMPLEARGNFPLWLKPFFERALGRGLMREMAAMEKEAPLDLRVNTLRADRVAALAALQEANIEGHPMPFSPIGLRVFTRVSLGNLEFFRSGAVEVQDEASQLVALLADARPGMRVVDFCAGAGGKTLALAASMKNRGHLVACDVAARRLERATQRLRRAGISIVQRVPIADARDRWVKRHAGGFDRVFIDAPCTGTGTWRRNPDAKWRLQPEDLAALTALQADILDSAQRLVKPGGRLAYATCSLLKEEDEDQIDRFLAAHADFVLVPISEVWRDVLEGDCPARDETLRLSPARHGTDGFFVAILARRALAPKASPADDVP